MVHPIVTISSPSVLMANSGLSSISAGQSWSRCSQAACIPAACAPQTSATGLSPTNRMSAGGTPRRAAAAWKMAGSGFFRPNVSDTKRQDVRLSKPNASILRHWRAEPLVMTPNGILASARVSKSASVSVSDRTCVRNSAKNISKERDGSPGRVGYSVCRRSKMACLEP